ncbi:MAG: type II toxin-antitoxin system RelE/ParE family toxin [Halobacteriales archaeon]|nr:type II toxin-antitoxin system RelE/ParE family toxin [Halobacteriales archaeon]
MRVRVGSVAQADLRALPGPTRKRLKAALEQVREDPVGLKGLLDVRRLQTSGLQSSLYRLRIGQWRIVYRFRGNDAEVIRVFHRSEGYSWMERLGF